MKNSSKIVATAAVVVILILAIVGSIVFARSHAEGPWIDATDTVAEEGAATVGREAADPLINTDQGNMLVFFFTMAGLAGGSIVGYYWRKLFIENEKEATKGPDRASVAAMGLAIAWLVLASYEGFATDPFINPELGDVKLFIFIFIGSIIGFIAGYQWRHYAAGRQGKRQLAS